MRELVDHLKRDLILGMHTTGRGSRSSIQGVPKKMESNFKFRLFKDDLII